MFLICMVVFIVVMVIWLVGAGWYFDRANPWIGGPQLLAWIAVLIVGLVCFGAVSPGPLPNNIR